MQLALGLATLPLSAQHLDGSVMMQLAGWAQSIVTFQSNAVGLLAGVSWVFKLHMALGMTVFLIFPFTRLVHVWSGFGTLAYIARPYQLVRARRMMCLRARTNPAKERSRAHRNRFLSCAASEETFRSSASVRAQRPAQASRLPSELTAVCLSAAPQARASSAGCPSCASTVFLPSFLARARKEVARGARPG